MVEPVAKNDGTLRWTETENGLPLPLLASNATQALLLKLTDIQEALNQEPLRVTGLEAGQYKLTIGSAGIGLLPPAAFATGINLGDDPAPLRPQPPPVGWVVRARAERHIIH